MNEPTAGDRGGAGMRYIAVFQYELDVEANPDAFLERMSDLQKRLAGHGSACVWVALGEPCERVMAAVEAEVEAEQEGPAGEKRSRRG